MDIRTTSRSTSGCNAFSLLVLFGYDRNSKFIHAGPFDRRKRAILIVTPTVIYCPTSTLARAVGVRCYSPRYEA